MAGTGEDAYCTLLLNDAYLPGALVLAHSLRDHQTTKKLAVLVTLDTVSPDSIADLKELYDYVIPVDKIRNPNPANLYLMDRGDLSFAFTKIAVWRLLQFRKVVYLDADVVALRAPDELFDVDAPFAAAPDVGWPDLFNSGVMVITPNMGDYGALQSLASTGDSFDGADQGLLNQYYRDHGWHRLSFTYNCTPNAQYQWEPAYRHFRQDINLVHFIGKQKPWSNAGAGRSGTSTYNELLDQWWKVHDRHEKTVPSSAPAVVQPPDASGTGEYPGRETPSDTARVSSWSMGDVVQSTEVQETSSSISNMKPTEEPISVPQRSSKPQHVPWDATQSAPPTESLAEAIYLPSQVYHFNDEKTLFRAPSNYPEPPKDMYYEVPRSRPVTSGKPKPIFPWEEYAPPPSRVFADDIPSSAAPSSRSEQKDALSSPLPSSTTESAVRGSPSANTMIDDEALPMPSETDSVPTPSDEPWHSYFRASNVWDTMPGINQYVRAVKDSQERISRQPQFDFDTMKTAEEEQEGDDDQKFASLVLTDFPSEIERPSLPVTPVPIHRPAFWSDEREASIELPSAEGVPSQAEWDPSEKLEELRHHSVDGSERLRMPIPHRATPPPLRELPERLADLSSHLSRGD